MNTLKWLLRREFWEHKGGLFWAPAVVSALMVAVLALSLAIPLTRGDLNSQHLNIGGMEYSRSVTVGEVLKNPDAPVHIANALSYSFIAAAVPLSLTMGFVVFFYFIGALYDDRSNRSVLFWKSLPISDRDTVLAKLGAGLLLAPALLWAAAVLVSLLMSLIVGLTLAALGVNVFGELLAHPRFYRFPLEFLLVWPVHVLWALPCAGWLLMVSAWARSKPFLWAVGVPLLAGMLLAWAKQIFALPVDPGWFMQHIVSRILLSATPGIWALRDRGGIHLRYDDLNDYALSSSAWSLLGTAELWIGVVTGVAMIAVAIRLRRYRDEG